MAKVIHKYILPAPVSVLYMRKWSTILCAANQKDNFTIWVEEDLEVKETQERKFEFVGTGHPVPDNALYIDTAQFNGGGLVFHLYEIIT